MRVGGAGAMLLLAAALAGTAVAGDRAGVLPRSATVAGRTLALNGAAVQTKLWFQVYTVALYLEAPVASAAEAWRLERPKALRLLLHRHASRSQIGGALRDGMRRAGADLVALEPRLGRLLAAIPDMEAGESLQIDYVPGQGTMLTDSQGRSLRIEGKDFADALFGVWLGPSPEMARIRRGLVGERPPAPASQARAPAPSRP